MEIVSYIFLFFFLVIGLCDFLHSIHIRIISPRKKLKKIVVCRLDDGEAEEQINYLAQQYRWYGNKCFDKFICLCDKDRIQEDFECSDAFCFIDINDISNFFFVLGEEYGLKFQQH